MIKCILWYIKGILHHGLHISRSDSSELIIYSDADWVGCPNTRRLTSGYCAYLGGNLVSWSSKWQQTVSRSSAEVEYRGVANAVAKSCWLRQLLQKLGYPPKKATVYFVTMSVQLICPKIQCIINAPNTLKLIFIS
jgi:hypothetical protein